MPIPSGGKEVTKVAAISENGLVTGLFKDRNNKSRSFLWNVRAKTLEDLDDAKNFTPIGIHLKSVVGVSKAGSRCSIEVRGLQAQKATPFKKEYCQARKSVSIDRTSIGILLYKNDSSVSKLIVIKKGKVTEIIEGNFYSSLGLSESGEIVLPKSGTQYFEFLLVNPSTGDSRTVTLSTTSPIETHDELLVLPNGKALGIRVKCTDIEIDCKEALALMDPAVSNSFVNEYFLHDDFGTQDGLYAGGIADNGDIYGVDWFFIITASSELVASNENGEKLSLTVVNDRTRTPFEKTYFSVVRVAGKYISTYASDVVTNTTPGLPENGAYYLLIRE